MKNKLTKKQITIIKLGLPILLLILVIIAIVSGDGLKGLMGNTTFDHDKCSCEEGWQEGDNNTCFQENVTESQISAYLLGDANNDGSVNSEDFDIIEETVTQEQTYGSSASNTSVELDTRQEVVYDINKDEKVDSLDREKFNELFDVSSVGGKILNSNYEEEYVCPKSKTEETTDEYGQTITTKTDYKQDEKDKQICYITTTIKVSKKAVCETNELGNTSSISPNTEIEEPKETTDEPKYELNIQTNICTENECNNDTEIKTKSKDTKMPNEEPQTSEIIIKNNGEENDED